MSQPQLVLRRGANARELRQTAWYFGWRLAVFVTGFLFCLVSASGVLDLGLQTQIGLSWAGILVGSFFSQGVLNVVCIGLRDTPWKPLRPLYWVVVAVVFASAAAVIGASIGLVQPNAAQRLFSAGCLICYAIFAYAALGGLLHRERSYHITPFGAARKDFD